MTVVVTVTCKLYKCILYLMKDMLLPSFIVYLLLSLILYLTDLVLYGSGQRYLRNTCPGIRALIEGGNLKIKEQFKGNDQMKLRIVVDISRGF